MSFLIAQQHIGDPAADGELMSRLWALQAALQHIYVLKHVVHLPQKFLITVILVDWPFCHLGQRQGIGHLHKCHPLHPGHHTCHKVRVELHRVDADLSGLEVLGEARGPHILHMQPQEVVGE